ncbi:hypothetical protein [Streptomyces sp. NPDC001770]
MALPEQAAQSLGPREQYRISVLDDALGERATPALAAAGYHRDTHVVLARETAGCVLPDPAAPHVALAGLRDAVLRQQLLWFRDGKLARQLTDRRAARLRGAAEVLFLPPGHRRVRSRPGPTSVSTGPPGWPNWRTWSPPSRTAAGATGAP